MFAPKIAKQAQKPAQAVSLGKFSIPLIRRAYPSLIASKLVSVQPMTQPASLIFHLRHKYSNPISFDNVYYAVVAIKRGKLIISRNIEIPGVECVLTKKLSDKVFAVVFEDGTVKRFSQYTVSGNHITIKIKSIKRSNVRTGQAHKELNEQEVITN